MPLQNRVTPFGEIVPVAARGRFTGNRGIIHDPATRTLLPRRWTSKAWLVCSLEHKGVRRDVMATRSWTELFFLDEATALAAGHRPCFACRRDAAEAYREAWARGNGLASPRAAEMDAVLHRERLDKNRKRLHALPAGVMDLPSGTMIAAGEDAFLIAGENTFHWSFEGYHPQEATWPAQLLTPPSTIRALAAGYRPELHPSVRGE